MDRPKVFFANKKLSHNGQTDRQSLMTKHQLNVLGILRKKNCIRIFARVFDTSGRDFR